MLRCVSGRHSRLLLLLTALGFAFGPSCASLQRKPRTSLAVAGGYSRVEHETFDCGAEEPIQRHTQVGGVAEVQAEERSGARYGGRAALLRGHYDQGQDIQPDPDRSPYWLPGLGGFGGWDSRYFGG